ncbi:legumain 2 [Aphelenchoides avenae]|nr:legumain 2 [Aphelenchus avenae]
MDHGSTGAFWLRSGDENISKKELHDTLTQLHADGKYSELTFYMDACHSGSMFDTLPSDLSTPLFSAAWLHDLEQSQSDESLQAQFESLKEIVAKSPDDHTNQKVSQYGNKGIAKEPIIDFEVGRENNAEELLHAYLTITKLDCHHDSINAFHDKCMRHLPKTQEALSFTGVIGNLCESGFTSDHIVDAMDEVCA